MKRVRLGEDEMTEQVQRRVAQFHISTVQEVCAAVERDALVVVGMAQNPFVGKATRALSRSGLQFTYLEYGSYLSQWKKRLAIKMWSGWPTFPQVFVRGTLVGGNAELQAMLEDGSLGAKLDATAE